MARKVFGDVNVGILLGLGQFVTTFLITQLYVRHAGRNTDPISDEMRERLERHEYASPAAEDGSAEGVTRA